MSASRGLAALGALTGLGGLALQLALMLGADGADPLQATWEFFGYFTILTNCLVTLVFARAALRAGADDGLNAPRIELMAVTSILFVCAVYNILLASRWDPQGWQLAADVMLHQATPLIFALYWLARPHGRLGWRDALFAALWPMGYAAYGLTRGAFDGFYPYFFMNPSTTPLPQVALNMVGLTLAFCIGAMALVFVDGVFSKRAAQRA